MCHVGAETNDRISRYIPYQKARQKNMASNQAIIRDVHLVAMSDSVSELPAPLDIPSDALMWTLLKNGFPIVALHLKESFITHH